MQWWTADLCHLTASWPLLDADGVIGLSWSQLVSDGLRWPQLVSDSQGWSQLVSVGHKGDRGLVLPRKQGQRARYILAHEKILLLEVLVSRCTSKDDTSFNLVQYATHI